VSFPNTSVSVSAFSPVLRRQFFLANLENLCYAALLGWRYGAGMWILGIIRDYGAGPFLLGVLCVIVSGGCAVQPVSARDAILQGAEGWNRWRAENPSEMPDLSGMVLEGAALESADLRGVRLAGAVLREADLRGAKLGGADLGRADLRGAKLGEADLSGADLREADLGDVDLAGADLSRADLGGANLQRGRLAGANLSGAHVGRAKLRDADLSNATINAIADWREIPDFQGVNIYRVVRAPGGFKDFALERGARKSG